MSKTSYRPWLMLVFAMLMLLVSNGLIPQRPERVRQVAAGRIRLESRHP